MAATSDPACGNTICVFDALDECRDRDRNQLIKYLCKFYERRPASQRNYLKFFVTSRPYGHIEDSFRLVTKLFPQIHLRGEEENDTIHKEINLVVKIKVANLPDTFGLTAETKRFLEEKLLHMEHRTYLWLKLANDDIQTTLDGSLCPNQEPFLFIPKTVDEGYEKILSRIKPEEEMKARKIFQIIIGARRPLTVEEMGTALGLALGHGRILGDTGISVSILEKKIRRLCGLFVFVKNSTIHLIHQTAREFLIARANRSPERTQWRQSVDIQDANLTLLKVCMTYLCQRGHQENYNQLSEGGGDNTESEQFLWYSATYWISHMKNVTTPTNEVLRLAESLCSVEKVSTWTGFVEAPFRYIRYDDEPLPFFWAARWGLAKVADRLVQDIEITDDVVEKAASHVSSGNLLMGLLLDRRGDDIKINAKILAKAAANKLCGDVIIELLLDRRFDEIRVTEKVMKAATDNLRLGLSIVKLLLDRKGDEIKITNSVMISAVKNWNGADMTKFLLQRKGAEIRITRSIIRAASKNIPPEKETIFQLFHALRRIKRKQRQYRRNRRTDAGKWGFLCK